MKTCDLCRKEDPNGYRRIFIAPPPLPMREGIVVDVCYNCYMRNKKHEIFQYPFTPEIIFDESDKED